MKFLTFILFFSFQLHAGEDLVATVLLKKGIVKAKLKDGSTIDLALEQKIPTGVVVETGLNSFVKLIFVDKSQMSLGPKSQMSIQAFTKNEAGIIVLLKGQLRSKVTKNYMEIEDKNKSKLFIQTKTSAMGIRGTDFQVNYNPTNENSSLIVFEGKVAMGSIDRSMRDATHDQKKLEEIVSSTTAVMVKQGQFSAVALNIAERPLLPTKLDPKQFEAIKNTTGLDEPAPKDEKIQKYRDIIPPGVDSAVFINAPTEEIKAEIKAAKGFYDNKTGNYKPAAGSILDLNTVVFIPPAAGSNYNSTTQTFTITPNYGKINEQSGEYIPPKGFQLSSDGKFQAVSSVMNKETGTTIVNVTKGEKPTQTASSTNTTGANLDSEIPKAPLPPLSAIIIPPPVINPTDNKIPTTGLPATSPTNTTSPPTTNPIDNKIPTTGLPTTSPTNTTLPPTTNPIDNKIPTTRLPTTSPTYTHPPTSPPTPLILRQLNRQQL